MHLRADLTSFYNVLARRASDPMIRLSTISNPTSHVPETVLSCW